MTSRVRGSSSRPYDVSVQVKLQGSAVAWILGECTCPVGVDCKHVVATLVRGLTDVVIRADPPAATRLQEMLSYELREWLERVEELIQGVRFRDGEAIPHGNSSLLYILQPAAHGRRGIELELFQARRRKDGRFGSTSVWSPPVLDPARLPKFVRAEDLPILESISLLGRRMLDRPALCGRRGASLLAELLATGRCYWVDANSPPLSVGESRRGEPGWKLLSNGSQQLTLLTAPANNEVIPVDPPWYIDLERSVCGPIETAIPARLAEQVATAPRCLPSETQQFSRELEQLSPDLPAPQIVDLSAAEMQSPTAILRFSSRRRSGWYRRASVFPDELETVCVVFRYQEQEIVITDSRDVLTYAQEGRVRCVARDREFERQVVQRIQSAGLVNVQQLLPGDMARALYEIESTVSAFTFPLAKQQQWPSWLSTLLSTQELHGWIIEFSAGFRYQLVQAKRMTVSLGLVSGWLECELGVEVDDKSISLSEFLIELGKLRPEAVQQLLAQNPESADPMAWRLPDGRLMLIPLKWVQAVLRTFIEIGDPNAFDRQLRLRVALASALDAKELEAAGIDVRLDQGLAALQRLAERRVAPKPVAAPRGLRTELRDYQRAGLTWLQWLREAGVGGVLADDMGLGKTVQALAHLLVEKKAGRLAGGALVVAPTSLVTNWEAETERFAPSLKCLILHGADRAARFDQIGDADLVISTYPLLLRDIETLERHRWSTLILDEAQYVKNASAQSAKAVRRLQADQRIAMSGTPMENHLGELWAVVDAVSPGLLGDRRGFARAYRAPIEQGGDASRRQLLERRLAPFMLRRTKEQVAKELPAKTQIIQRVELQGAQRTLYEALRASTEKRVREAVAKVGIDRCQIVIFEALLRLRQICCDPQLVDVGEARRVTQSAKGELLWELLPALLDEGRRVLLFSTFSSMLQRIDDEAKRRGIQFAKLTGATKDRQKQVSLFQAGNVPLMLISLKAGGVGLNLTAADTVIHYDPWWNPAAEDQATDRAHRIGQDKPVFVYKLIAAGTVEEKMLELQARKRELVEGVIKARNKPAAGIGAEDLEFLFG